MDQAFGWDEVAPAYADRFGRELDRKPFDRKAVEWLAERAASVGLICDLGCGPGQVAGLLHSLGHGACGIDTSPEMVRQAKERHPGIEFEVGDMCDLSGVTAASFGGLAAFYSIVNIPPADLRRALVEMLRVLRPDGGR